MMIAVGNLSLTDLELQDMMYAIDENNDGHVQFDEFVKFVGDFL